MTLPASGLLKLSQIRSEYSPTTDSYSLSAYAKYLGKSAGAPLIMSEFYGKSSPHGVVAIDSTTPGSGNLSVPYGVTQAKVYAHGGGGGGAGASQWYSLTYGGGGGGSGGRNGWPTTISVTPGGSLSYGIGAGGVGTPSVSWGNSMNASSGGTTFAGTSSASGGGGGGYAAYAWLGAGGAAGSPNGVAGQPGTFGNPANNPAIGGNTGFGAGTGGNGGYAYSAYGLVSGQNGSPGRLRVEWV